jgi:lipoate-protein ligase A
MVCIDNPYTDAYFNLAAEEYLLEQFPGDVFMLWQNDSSVIVGKHQNVEAEVNLEFAREHRIKVVRRHSGGGTVYHDAGNINLTFIENSTHPDFGKYPKRMLEILASVGIQAYEDERHTLYIDGLKISGCAQFIRKNKVLFHATLLFSSNLTTLAATLDSLQTAPDNGLQTKKKHYVPSVKSPVTNISEHLPMPLTLAEFKQIVLRDFLKSSADSSYAFSSKDLAAIDKLRREKYLTNDWNFQA